MDRELLPLRFEDRVLPSRIISSLSCLVLRIHDRESDAGLRKCRCFGLESRLLRRNSADVSRCDQTCVHPFSTHDARQAERLGEARCRDAEE